MGGSGKILSVGVWIFFNISINIIVDKYCQLKENVILFQVSVNAWFWSIVFHTRDLNWTEVICFHRHRDDSVGQGFQNSTYLSHSILHHDSWV